MCWVGKKGWGSEVFFEPGRGWPASVSLLCTPLKGRGWGQRGLASCWVSPGTHCLIVTAVWAHCGGMCIVEPLPPPGKGKGAGGGATLSTDKRFCRALLSLVLRSLWKQSAAPHRPRGVIFWLVTPFPRGPGAPPGPDSHLSPAPRQGAPLPSHTTNTLHAFPHLFSIVFKEISGSHQVHPNAPLVLCSHFSEP